MRGKLGISAIVATVLIILITVAGVSIIWIAIVPMINDRVDFNELEGRVSIVTSGGYTVYDVSKKVAIVQVKRGVDDDVMDRIRIIFTINGSSYSAKVVAPDSGGTKTYTFNLSGYGAPSSVSVAPIFVSGSGEKEGEISSVVDVPVGDVIEIDGFVYGLGVEKSCLEILYRGNSVGDGVYIIDPAIDGGFEVYCDMTSDEGGWTLAMNGQGADISMNSDDSFWWTSGSTIVLNSLAISGKSDAYDTVGVNEFMMSTTNGDSVIIASVDASASSLGLIGQWGDPGCNNGTSIWNNGFLTFASSYKSGTFWNNDYIKIWHGDGQNDCNDRVVLSTDDNLDLDYWSGGGGDSNFGVLGGETSYSHNNTDWYRLWVR